MATATRANDCPPASGLAAVLANSGYRRLFIAQTISRWGDIANTVALVMLVFQLTGPGLKVSGVVIAEILPMLLLAPVAGTVADRLPRIGVMVTADLWRTGLTALLPLASHHLAAVYAIAFVRPAGGVFFNPAAASVLPAVVDEDELIAASSGLWSAAVVSQIALAPLAGAIVTTRGRGSSVLLQRGHFRRLRAYPGPAAAAPCRAIVCRRVLGSRCHEGGRLLIRDPLLRLLALVQLLAALSAGATGALLVVLAERPLHAGPAGFGLLLGAIGAGAAIAPVLLARLTSNPRRPALVFGPLLLRGAVDLILASTRSLPAAIGALALYGVGTSTGMVTYTSLLQAQTAPTPAGACSPDST